MLQLHDCRLKIDRAKEHIRALDEAIAAFLGTKPYAGVPRYSTERDVTEFVLETLPEVPKKFSLYIGDAAHNLRTALDYLAVALVRSTGAATKNIYFPITETAAKYKADSAGKTKGMPPEAKAFIDQMQPYGDGNYWFWALHNLDVIDKHHLLPMVGMSIQSWTVNPASPDKPVEIAMAMPQNFNEPFGLQLGDVIGWMQGNCDRNKTMGVQVELAFTEPESLGGCVVVKTLDDLAGVVGDVVNAFDAKF